MSSHLPDSSAASRETEPRRDWRFLRWGARTIGDSTPASDIGSTHFEIDSPLGCLAALLISFVAAFAAALAFLLLLAMLDIAVALVALAAAAVPVALRRAASLAGMLHGWRLVLVIEVAIVLALLGVWGVRRLL
jgi:hypothetical protein